MEISRDFYLDKLIKRKHNGLIKVITGIRRCGKSYLLNNLFYHHLLNNGVNADHIIRFAFDSADDLYLIGESLIQIQKEKRGIDPEKFMAYIRSKVADDGMYYLLLDEIQMLDCFEAVLNGYLRKDNMDVFVTGSNAKLLSKDIATEFAGRGDEIHMYPLSFAEFMNVYNGDKYMGLSEYMLYGGIPLVVLREGANDKAAALQNDLLKALQKSGAKVTIAAGADGTSAANVAITVEGYDVASDGKVSKDGVDTGIKLTASAGNNNSTGTVALSDTLTLDSKAVTAAAKGAHAAFYDKDGNKISENALSNYFTSTTAGNNINTTKLKDKTLYDAFGNTVTPVAANIQSAQDQVGSLKLSLHVGADATSNNKIELNLDAMSAKGLGVNGLRVDGATSTNADNAIETIKEAIQKVSTQRSALGAVQNRLEHTINNLDNVVENTTSAESAIRDTDMATEMVKYSNNNILSQAGQAMLAQANQSNQGVLSLLQ